MTNLNAKLHQPVNVVVLLAGVALHCMGLGQAQTTVQTMAAVSSADTLVKEIEQGSRYDVTRDSRGNVVALRLLREWVTDWNLTLVSEIGSLKEVSLVTSKTNDLSGRGISSLSRLTNLVSVQVNCGGSLPKGVFREVCNLRRLQHLGLAGAYPPAEEYTSITNLNNLTDLRVVACTNFTDKELNYLTNLVNLRSLVLYYDGISKEGTNVLQTMNGLTNVIVKLDPRIP